jgi:ATP-dependent protease HslVU (ClpYQ) peptidase subunit
VTCIVGIIHNDRCWIGGDSVVSWSGIGVVMNEPKVRAVGGYVLGVSGGLRETNLAMTWGAPQWGGADAYRWLVRKYVTRWRRELKRAKISKPELWQLLGINGQLFAIGTRGSVHSWADGYGAIGCGTDVALGVLEATRGERPKRRIKAALRAAAHYDPTRIGKPWHLVHD